MINYKDLIHKQRVLTPHKTIVDPDFDSKPIQVRNHWEFVDMWLHKHKAPKAAKLHWSQAQNFFQASQTLDYLSSPLTLYYCILNITKTLLITKGIHFKENHGVSGEFNKGGDTNLKNEVIRFHSKGILPQLSNYLKCPLTFQKHSLYEVLYNLPYIHRSFCISNNNISELFIPIKKPQYVCHTQFHNGWICAELKDNYANQHTLNKLKNVGYEKVQSVNDKCIIKYKRNFKWYFKGNKRTNNISRLQNYQIRLRQHLHYIMDENTSWYIKRCCVPGVIDIPVPVLTFAAMHKFSELSRYNPERLDRHLELSQKWVISEFLTAATIQFIDQIAAEITHQNIQFTRK